MKIEEQSLKESYEMIILYQFISLFSSIFWWWVRSNWWEQRYLLWL